jgi:hypothetical protein
MGGRIDMAEVHLEVPTDAVDSDILIMVRRVSVAAGAIGPAFAFQPTNPVFARSLGIAIDLPQPLTELPSRIGMAGLSGPIWRNIAGATIRNDNQVVAAVTQLATFAAVLTCGSNDECASGRCDTGACQAGP